MEGEYVSTIKIVVNGTDYKLQVSNRATLLEVLREKLGLKGTKSGCDEGQCGACTVLLNGEPVYSCITLAVMADGGEIITIEGLSSPSPGTGRSGLHPLQRAFITENAVQCGFCTPGMILSARALLAGNEDPTGEEIKQGLSGNICRCSGYKKIITAVKKAAGEMKSKKTQKNGGG